MIAISPVQGLVEEIINSWSLIILIYWFVPELRAVKLFNIFNLVMLFVLPLLGNTSFIVYLSYIALLCLIIVRKTTQYEQYIIGISFAWMIWALSELTADWLCTNFLFKQAADVGSFGWVPMLSDDGLGLILIVLTGLFVKSQLAVASQNFAFFEAEFKRSMLGAAVVLALVGTSLIFIVHTVHYKGYNSGIVVIAFFFIIIISIWLYRMFNRMYQRLVQQKLDIANYEFLQQYNELLVDSDKQAHAFRHDISNLLLGIEGYADEGDIPGLSNYLKQVLDLTNQRFGSDAISTELAKVTNLGIKHILLRKIRLAQQLGIHVSLVVDTDFNLGLTDVEAVRLLSILVDNAIEATQTNPENGQIVIALVHLPEENRLVIKNTITESVDIEHLYDFGHSTKPNHSGIGLNTVRDIVNQYDVALLSLQATPNYFQITLTVQEATPC
ncbi:GHKL domain-containing protein [Periweissella cryptocerci]|uniref:GHKL domain-containing protein n=1 Tax=Periweissella cryptocerci TaxID=2506420 RepID=A0A4P6YRD0_9LACO|nr:GHKL domain-containing protein [Periweissella cryptocerci]QBO35152.1 GHKL domain-containing protein [Periweissella cryptocerci]